MIMSNEKKKNDVIDPKTFKDEDLIEKRKRKFNVAKLIKEFLVEVMEIDASELTQSQKTTKHARAAQKVLNALYGKRAQKGRNALTFNTASAHLRDVRNAVTNTGVKHHAYQQSLDRIRNKFPHCAYMLSGMDDLPVKETRLKHRDLLEKLRFVKILEKYVKGITPGLNNYASLINNRAKELPEWEHELLALKTIKKEDRAAAIENLNKIIEESREFYQALKDMKIDHEVMRHLRKDAFAKDTKATEQKRTLEEKKSNAVTIDYVKTMQVVNMLFEYAVKLDKWEALAVAIAFATGRRPIEVLVQGEFEKIDQYNLRFIGQAKKREGVTNEEMIIYTLVEADKVLDAIDSLRSYPNILGLQNLEPDRNYSVNALVHNRTSGPLNEFIDSLLKTKPITSPEADSQRNWLFKDTRAIYTKICFELFFKTDPRWKKKDENMFYKELLGHDELDTQAHYMQFKIINAGGDYEPIVIDADKRRLEAVKEMTDNEWIQGSKARQSLHQFVIELLTEQPWRTIIASDLRKGRNYKMVKQYMDLMEDRLKLNWLFEAVMERKASEVKAKKEIEDQERITTELSAPNVEDKIENDAAIDLDDLKPKFKPPHQRDDGSWLVSFTINDEDIIEEVTSADNMMLAGQYAWSQWKLGKSLPRKAPIPTVTKDGAMWYSRINIDGQTICEAWTGSKTASRDSSLAMYKKMLR